MSKIAAAVSTLVDRNFKNHRTRNGTEPYEAATAAVIEHLINFQTEFKGRVSALNRSNRGAPHLCQQYIAQGMSRITSQSDASMKAQLGKEARSVRH